MTTLIRELIANDEGQDLIEYALLATFISLAGIAGVSLLNNAVSSVFSVIAGQLEESGAP
jgi:Flp pilus assembly pilin Flp